MGLCLWNLCQGKPAKAVARPTQFLLAPCRGSSHLYAFSWLSLAGQIVCAGGSRLFVASALVHGSLLNSFWRPFFWRRCAHRFRPLRCEMIGPVMGTIPAAHASRRSNPSTGRMFRGSRSPGFFIPGMFRTVPLGVAEAGLRRRQSWWIAPCI